MWDRDLEAGRPGAGKGAGQGKNPKANCLLHTFALGHFFSRNCFLTFSLSPTPDCYPSWKSHQFNNSTWKIGGRHLKKKKIPQVGKNLNVHYQ